MASIGLVWYLVLYYWLIPTCKFISISVVAGLLLGSLVSRIHRHSVLGVCVVDKTSLTGILVSACTTVLLLAAAVGLFVPGWVVLIFLFLSLLFQRWYITLYIRIVVVILSLLTDRQR